MDKIINISRVTDFSGEPPVVTDSNPVTTVLREPPPVPKIRRIFYDLPCCMPCAPCCSCFRCRHCCHCGENPCCDFDEWF